MSNLNTNLDIKEDAAIAAVTELGGATVEHKPEIVRLIIGYVFAAIIIGGSVALAFGMPLKAGRSWLWLLALLGTPIGAGLLYYVRDLAATRIYVCEKGIVYAHGSKATAFAWDRVVKIQQFVVSSTLPARGLLGRVPVGQLSTYRLTRDDGEEMGFNRESVNAARRLAEHIAEQAERHKIDWEVVQDD